MALTPLRPPASSRFAGLPPRLRIRHTRGGTRDTTTTQLRSPDAFRSSTGPIGSLPRCSQISRSRRPALRLNPPKPQPPPRAHHDGRGALAAGGLRLRRLRRPRNPRPRLLLLLALHRPAPPPDLLFQRRRQARALRHRRLPRFRRRRRRRRPPAAPTARAPAASNGAATEFERITVSDPKKHAEPVAGAAGVIPGSGSYFSYLVTTRLADGGGEFRVRRRFRDVVALADRLAAAHRGLFVPARPDKSLVEGQVMQRHDFVSQRCTALQRYLRRLAAHPVVGGSPDLRTFLTEPGAIPAFQGEAPRYWTTTVNAAIQQVPTKAGRDLFGMFKDLRQTVVNGLVATKPPPVEEETDTEFLSHKSRLQDLQQQLTTTSQQAESLVKSQDDLRTSTAHLGMTLIKLAKFEREHTTCISQRRRAGLIHNFANSVVKFSRSQAKLNSEIVQHLDSIHEYLEMMISVHHAFTDRSNALQHVQSLSADIFFLHTRAGRLESVSSKGIGQEWTRYQKIEGLKETISTTEEAKNHALREYESIKENNMNEIRRFDNNRRRDLIEMLKGFVVNQVSYSDHFANMWGKVAEETKVFANRSN